MEITRFIATVIGLAVIVLGQIALARAEPVTAVPCTAVMQPPGPGGGAVITPPPPPPMMLALTPGVTDDAAWHAAALKGCSDFKSLITPGNWKLLGFDSVQVATLLHIGKPFDIYSIGIDELAVHLPGQPVAPLLKNLTRRVYPVIVRGNVVSSILVSRKKTTGELITTGWGLPKLIVKATKYKHTDSDYIVWVPALNLHFIGDHLDETLLLTPLETRDLYGLKEGVAISGAVVVALLAQRARTYDRTGPG